MEDKAKKIILSAIMGQIEALVDDAYAQGVEAGTGLVDDDDLRALLVSTIAQVKDLYEHADTAKGYADDLGFKRQRKGSYGSDDSVVPGSDKTISKIVTFLDDNEGFLVISPDDDNDEMIENKDNTIEACGDVFQKSGLLLATLTNKLAAIEK